MHRDQPGPPGVHCNLSLLVFTVVFPQQYGLYSAFMGCFVYFFLGTSRDVTLGPTAIMSLLVSFYTFHEPAYAVLLAFLSGCIQLAMGLLHLGKICCGEWLPISIYRGGGASILTMFCTGASSVGAPEPRPFLPSKDV